MIIKTKQTETIIKEKGYKRKLQPKVNIQKYDYPKEEVVMGSKKEILRMRKILKLRRSNEKMPGLQ